MRCKQWIFDMDGTLTDSMTVVWRGAPLALLQRYGRTPKADLNDVLLTMGMADGARYLIRAYDLPLTEAEYYDVMRDVIAQLYETVDLKPGVRTLLAKLQAEGARLCLCSNTWSDQCRTVLTRLGIADYFSFIVEAQGVLHKSRPAGRGRPRRLRRVRGRHLRRFHCPQGRVHRAGRAGRRQCRRCPCHGAGVRPVPAGLDRTGLDKDLRNFSAKNTPVFPLWEHRRAVISGCISAAAPIAGRRPARHPPARGGWRCGPRCACAAPRQKAGPPRPD